MRTLRIYNLFIYVISFIFCLSLSNVTYSEVVAKRGEQQQWINFFPIGIKIHDIAIDPQYPNTIYVFTYRGELKGDLFKSVNGGKLWSHLKDFEIKGSYVYEKIESNIIRIDPTNSKTIYFGLSSAVNEGESKGGGLWRSKDGGVTWEEIGRGVIAGVYDIAINPKNSEILYIISGNVLYKTLNGGKTWGKIAKGASAYNVFLNPNSPDEVYVSLQNEAYTPAKLYRSIDGGQDFKIIESPTYISTHFYMGSSEERKCEKVYGMLNPYNTQEMFAVCHDGPAFFKSLDGGISWIEISPKEFKTGTNMFGKEIEIYNRIELVSVAFSSRDKNVIYFVGKGREQDKIFKSNDGGRTWILLPIPSSSNISDIEISSSNTIYVTTDQGIFKTVDDGANWESASFGLPAKMNDKKIGEKRLLWQDNISSSTYVGHNDIFKNGYWMSSDKGVTWKWNSSHVKKSSLDQLVLTTDKVIYFVYSGGGVFKVIADQEPIKIETPYPPRQLAVSSSNPKILYLSAREVGPWSPLLSDILFKSEDAGFSWTEIDWKRWLPLEQDSFFHDIDLLSVDHNNPNILFMVASHRVKGLSNPKFSRAFSLLKTTDGGNTWKDITPGLSKPIESVLASSKWLYPGAASYIANSLISSLTSVVIDPSNSNIVYITTSNCGVYRSDDEGKTWKAKSPQNYLKTVVDVLNKNVAQRCSRQKNCIKGNLSEVQEVLGKVIGVSFNNISIYSSNPKIIYLATSNGVYRSFDRGETWELLNQGLLDMAVRKVIASSSTVIAEGESGIYKLSE